MVCSWECLLQVVGIWWLREDHLIVTTERNTIAFEVWEDNAKVNEIKKSEKAKNGSETDSHGSPKKSIEGYDDRERPEGRTRTRQDDCEVYLPILTKTASETLLDSQVESALSSVGIFKSQ